MARTAHPWYWEERNGWYVNKDGKRHFLGDHPEVTYRLLQTLSRRLREAEESKGH